MYLRVWNLILSIIDEKRPWKWPVADGGLSPRVTALYAAHVSPISEAGGVELASFRLRLNCRSNDVILASMSAVMQWKSCLSPLHMSLSYKLLTQDRWLNKKG